MTEAEWISSNDPAALLRWLSYTTGGGMGDGPPLWLSTDRKLRLFACACCRQVWDRLTDPCSRRAVEVAERYADGLATRKEMDLAWNSATDANYGNPSDPAIAANLLAICYIDFSDSSVFAVIGRFLPPTVQAALLRCVFGNPWRPAAGCQCDPDVGACPCEWCDLVRGTPYQLARSIHDERRPADLEILADALLEAGCPVEVTCRDCEGKWRTVNGLSTCEYEGGVWRVCRRCRGSGRVPHPLLAHLRQADGPCRWCVAGVRPSLGPFPEVRCVSCGGTGRVPTPHALPGCWAVDLILGKG
jgi:hypothetical protein